MDKSKILLVEDDIDSQIFLKFLLKKYELYICNNESDFYRKLNQHSIDLIIMDIAIKGRKDGLQLTREIKQNILYKNIPVLCLSAHVLEIDKQNAFNAGVDYFLEKPVSNAKLLEVINGFILTSKLEKNIQLKK